MRKVRCPLCGKDYKGETWKDPCPNCTAKRREEKDPEILAAEAEKAEALAKAPKEPKPVHVHHYRRANPWLAGVLSFFIPGVGQVYSGRVLRAVGWWLTAILVGRWFWSTRADWILDGEATAFAVAWVVVFLHSSVCAADAAWCAADEPTD